LQFFQTALTIGLIKVIILVRRSESPLRPATGVSDIAAGRVAGGLDAS
jgi:hypothetical protein